MENNSIQIAKLFIALEETKQRIYWEILPLCAHLAPEETAEMGHALELAASAIQQYQGKWQLSIELMKGDKQ